jgi:TonB family protein
MVAALLLAVTVAFVPPRLVSGEPPGLPAPNVVAGGEVLVEVTVDTSGAVSRAVLLRNTPPYGQMVLDAVSKWRFTPAKAPDKDGRAQTVESAVLVAAVYRPPTVDNGPTVGTAPLDTRPPSSATPYPVIMEPPPHPIQAFSPGVALLEVSIDEAGITRAVRTVTALPLLEAAARDAVAAWPFRGASFRGQPVPSMAYVIVGFPQPTIGSTAKK